MTEVLDFRGAMAQVVKLRKLLQEIKVDAKQGYDGKDHIVCHTCYDIYSKIDTSLQETSHDR